jgi:NAD(P)H-dependent nitrite reductase small subunit
MKFINQSEPDNEGFYQVCKLSDLKEKQGKKFIVNEVQIAVFKIGENVFALNNVCPHQHSAIIYDGFIEDDCIVCPAHGWKFRLTDGKLPSGSKGLESYNVKLLNEFVWIKVIQKKINW